MKSYLERIRLAMRYNDYWIIVPYQDLFRNLCVCLLSVIVACNHLVRQGEVIKQTQQIPSHSASSRFRLYPRRDVFFLLLTRDDESLLSRYNSSSNALSFFTAWLIDAGECTAKKSRENFTNSSLIGGAATCCSSSPAFPTYQNSSLPRHTLTWYTAVWYADNS